MSWPISLAICGAAVTSTWFDTGSATTTTLRWSVWNGEVNWAFTSAAWLFTNVVIANAMSAAAALRIL